MVNRSCDGKNLVINDFACKASVGVLTIPTKKLHP